MYLLRYLHNEKALSYDHTGSSEYNYLSNDATVGLTYSCMEEMLLSTVSIFFLPFSYTKCINKLIYYRMCVTPDAYFELLILFKNNIINRK